LSSSYERMLDRQMSTSFWGETQYSGLRKYEMDDPDKTREQMDDVEIINNQTEERQ